MLDIKVIDGTPPTAYAVRTKGVSTSSKEANISSA